MSATGGDKNFDPIADTWGLIGSQAGSQGAIGDPGDTIRTQIATGSDPVLFPAVDVSTTVQAGDDATILANRHVADLNGDANFSMHYQARRIHKDPTAVYITAKEPGRRGARPNQGDYQFTATGSTVVTPAFDNILQRKKVTTLVRDPVDPTLGIPHISGHITIDEGEIVGRFLEFATSGGSSNLMVNGSVTPVDFFIMANPDTEKFISSLRFAMGGNGIQFGQFLSKNGGLANGVEVTIRSNNTEFTFPPLQFTEDFKNNFGLGPNFFNLYDVSGTDHADATLTFTGPIQLHQQGTFPTDDFIRVRIRDDLTSGLQKFNLRAFGFTRYF